MLINIWKPLREKITFFLSQPPVGTDDKINLLNLRKADLNLLIILFNAQLDDVLYAPGIRFITRKSWRTQHNFKFGLE